MLLSQFSSLFELFAAFNFAYTLSDSFTKELNERVLRGFSSVNLNLTNFKEKIDLGKTNLFNIKEIKEAHIDTETRLEAAKEKLKAFESKIDAFTKRLNIRIEKAGITNSFKFLCFFSALYCLILLFVSGFVSGDGHTQNDAVLYEMLVGVNFFSSIFIIYCIKKDRINIKNQESQKQIGYRNTLKYFLIIFAVGLVWYILHKGWVYCYCLNENMILLVIVWSLLVPAGHFIYYFYRAYRNTTTLGLTLYNELQSIEVEYDKFNQDEVQRLDAFHKDFQNFRVDKKN
jgi:hypothetical protein